MALENKDRVVAMVSVLYNPDFMTFTFDGRGITNVQLNGLGLWDIFLEEQVPFDQSTMFATPAINANGGFTVDRVIVNDRDGTATMLPLNQRRARTIGLAGNFADGSFEFILFRMPQIN